jgi:hypothetical protein
MTEPASVLATNSQGTTSKYAECDGTYLHVATNSQGTTSKYAEYDGTCLRVGYEFTRSYLKLC